LVVDRSSMAESALEQNESQDHEPQEPELQDLSEIL